MAFRTFYEFELIQEEFETKIIKSIIDVRELNKWVLLIILALLRDLLLQLDILC